MTGLCGAVLGFGAGLLLLLLLWPRERRPHRRGGQRYVANPPRIPTQTTVPRPPPRRNRVTHDG